MKDIFIVGSKGIPAQYGGYETFVDNLVTRQQTKDIKYHVACMTFDKEVKRYDYNGADCQQITVSNIGGAKAIVYDLKALDWALSEIKNNNLHDGIIYILACRIGPFIHRYIPKFHKYGFQVWVNPDGHEWMRAKWSAPVRKYLKVSEGGMVKNADLLVCDSKNIEKYIHETYSKYNPNTTFIAYGANYSLPSYENIDYRGQVLPNELPDKLDNGFGLVWDGNSIDTCNGNFGEYLRYNNPHKLSLYLSSNLPVIIWEYAAEATFVKKHNLGITVKSLMDLPDVLDKVTERDYESMVRSIKLISNKLTNGEFTKVAVENALNNLEK